MSIISRFAGLVDAWAFAYGINSDAPAALQVINGSAIAGAFTITCQPASDKGPNAVSVAPTTTTPITVGLGSNAETVTPSSVSLDTLGNILITATFANAHAAGEQVRSGTYGLQEALNYAAGAGGGTVLTSASWFAGGGTAAIIDAATDSLPANVSIWQTNSAAGEQSITVAIPNASVLTLNSVGYPLIPAPGAGNLIVVSRLVVEQVAKTAAFANGGNITAAYGTQASQTAATGTIAATVLTGGAGTTNQIGMALPVAPANGNSSVLLNKAVGLYAATADFITGGGSVIAKVIYQVLEGF